MQTPSLKIAVVSLLFLVSYTTLVSQVLIPKIDEAPHNFASNVNSVSISEDGNFFLTSDSNGDAAYRDMKTGKILYTASTQNQFLGTTFVGFDNQKAIEIFRGSSSEDDPILKLSIWGIMQDDNNEIDILIEDLEENVYALSKTKDKSLISIRINNAVYVYNTETEEIHTLSVGSFDSSQGSFKIVPIVESYFEGNEKDLTIVSNDGEHYTIRKYNVQKGVEVSKSITQPYIIHKLLEGNKCILDKGDAFEFIDRQRNLSHSWPKEDLLNKHIPIGGYDVYSVNCFSFSPNGNQLIIGTGYPFGYTLVIGGLPNEISGGIIRLIDTKTNQLIWETSNSEQQHQYSIVHLSWLNDNQIFSADNRGDVQFYNTSSNLYDHAFLKPDLRSIAAEIAPNSNSLAYSIFNNNTFNFNFYANEPVELIDTNYNIFVSKGESGKTGLTGLFTQEHSILNNGKQLYSPNEFTNYGSDIDVGEDYSVLTNGHHNNNAYSFAQLPGISRFIFNSKQDTIGYYINDHLVFDRELKYIKYEVQEEISEKPDFYPDPNYYNSIYVMDHSTNSFFTLFEQGRINEYWVSRYGNILAYSCGDGFAEPLKYFLFDLDKRDWISKTKKNIAFNTFSKNEALAFTIFEDNSYQVWHTVTQEVLAKGVYKGQMPKYAVIRSSSNEIISSFGANMHVLNYKNGDQVNDEIGQNVLENMYLSWDQKVFGFRSNFTQNGSTQIKINLVNLETQAPLLQQIFTVAGDVAQWTGRHENIYFIDSTSYAWLYDGQGTFNLITYTDEYTEDIATLRVFPDGEWIVIAPNGLFDGSKEGRKNVYYLIDQEVVLFDQIKEKYWTPGLLKKILYEPHLLTEYGKDLTEGLFPTAELNLSSSSGMLNVTLTEREGGVGNTSFFINDKEVNSNLISNKRSNFSIDLLDYKEYFFQSGINKIGIQTHNKSGGLSSRHYELFLETNLALAKGGSRDDGIFATTTPRRRRRSAKKPGLYGLFVGTSKYSNPKLDLGFADKDAIELQNAFSLISKDMYNPSKVELKLLTSQSKNAEGLSSKENIISVLNEIGTKATPNDIIVLFFSGHGMTVGDDFYYLTGKAGNTDLENDSLARVSATVSAKEINEALRNIKSNKQVMVLDACHSGQITKILQGTSKATSTSQQKALEFLEDKMGVFILASSESNQKSFETDALGQGLLTYSLLRGMSGEAAEQNIINVVSLLNYASEEAEKTSKNMLGRSQRPVLNVAKGGSTFPIGFKNNALKVALPTGKVKLGNANFAYLPRANDPEGLEEIFKEAIKERGGIGSKEPFIYSHDNSSEKTYNLSGTYTISGNDITLNWYINKGMNEVLSEDQFTTTGSKKDKAQLANTLIDELIKKWKEMGLVEK